MGTEDHRLARMPKMIGSPPSLAPPVLSPPAVAPPVPTRTIRGVLRVPISAPRKSDSSFYIVSALVALGIVIAGFGHTAYLRRARAQPDIPLIIAVHAMLMAGWFVLFLAQASLVRFKRTALHTRLGWIVAVWAPLMVVSGVLAIRLRDGPLPTLAKLVTQPDSAYWQFSMLLTFALLVSSAVLLRKRPEHHKRLLLLSCFGLALAGALRLPLDGIPGLVYLQDGGFGGLLSPELLAVYACIAWDTRRNRRLHTAFGFGVLLLIVQGIIMQKGPGLLRLAMAMLS
jgi:hypothetical protein